MPYVTEQEAKTKVCLVRGSTTPYTHCIGSQCMAWRWQITTEKRERIICNPSTAETPPERAKGVGDDWEFYPHDQRDDGCYRPAMWVEDVSSFTKRTSISLLGYCGLGGSPK